MKTFVCFFAIAVSIASSSSREDKSPITNEQLKGFTENLLSKKDTEMEAHLNEWMKAKVNVAVMGNSGVGKSSFINKARDVAIGEAGYAEVGGGDTTGKPYPYAMPNNENITFWDMPGIDDLSFKLNDSTLKAWNVFDNDFVLIFYATTFHISEIKIANALVERGKNFSFVRTKIDEFLNERHHNPQLFHKNVKKIKEMGEDKLKKNNLDKYARIFAISTLDRSLGDFDELMLFILNSLNDIKFNSMILSMGCFSERIIDTKKATHQTAVWTECLPTLAPGFLPPPAGSILTDVYLVIIVTTYLNSFKLDAASIKKLPIEIQDQMKISKNIALSGILSFIQNKLEKLWSAKTLESTVAKKIDEFLHGIAPLLSQALAYKSCYSYLNSIIDQLSEESKIAYANKYKRFEAIYAGTKNKDEL